VEIEIQNFLIQELHHAIEKAITRKGNNPPFTVILDSPLKATSIKRGL